MNTLDPAISGIAASPAEQVVWHWPIDVSSYQRAPELTPAERSALLGLGSELRRGRLHDPQRPEWAAIARLLQPLDDARLSSSSPLSGITGVVRLMQSP